MGEKLTRQLDFLQFKNKTKSRDNQLKFNISCFAGEPGFSEKQNYLFEAKIFFLNEFFKSNTGDLNHCSRAYLTNLILIKHYERIVERLENGSYRNINDFF